MVAEKLPTANPDVLNLESIQQHLESATIERYWREPQWNPEQDVALTIVETIQQVEQTKAALRPDQQSEAPQHLEAALQALKPLTVVNPADPATPEQQANFEQAWKSLEQARIALCVTMLDRLHPMIGTIEGPPDLSSRPYLMKHGLWPKED